MYSRTGIGRGRPIRGRALARGNTRSNYTGQNSPNNFESRDADVVMASTDPTVFASAEKPIPVEDRDIPKYEMRWTHARTPKKHPVRKLATKADAMKELEEMLGRWYGWVRDEPEKPELPWRDDRSESEKIIPEPDYYCCPYSRERPVRLLTPPSRPVAPGPGVPYQRGQPLRHMYHRGRRCVDTSIPMYLRNGS